MSERVRIEQPREFVQHLELTNTLRTLAGEEPLHHTGLDHHAGPGTHDPGAHARTHDVDEPPEEPGHKDAA